MISIPQVVRDVLTWYTLYVVIAVGLSGSAVVRAVPMYIKGPWDRRFQGGVWIALAAAFTYYTYLYHQARANHDTEREVMYQELLLALTFTLAFLWVLPAILGFYGW